MGAYHGAPGKADTDVGAIPLERGREMPWVWTSAQLHLGTQTLDTAPFPYIRKTPPWPLPLSLSHRPVFQSIQALEILFLNRSYLENITASVKLGGILLQSVLLPLLGPTSLSLCSPMSSFCTSQPSGFCLSQTRPWASWDRHYVWLMSQSPEGPALHLVLCTWPPESTRVLHQVAEIQESILHIHVANQANAYAPS